jgi:hypothetical protein
MQRQSLYWSLQFQAVPKFLSPFPEDKLPCQELAYKADISIHAEKQEMDGHT